MCQLCMNESRKLFQLAVSVKVYDALQLNDEMEIFHALEKKKVCSASNAWQKHTASFICGYKDEK